MTADSPHNDPDHEPPPFFGSWKGMYALVLGTLIVLITLFYLLTIYYS